MSATCPWHDEPWRDFLAVHAAGRLPHALLLSGPPGIGLRQFARRVGQYLLCPQAPGNSAPCGACRSCRLFEADTHPDWLLVTLEEKKKQIPVEAIRDMAEWVFLKSQMLGYKVVLIDPAQALNPSSANALLKTFEEPPPATLLMLCTPVPQRLLVTVRSRCQRIELPPAGGPESVAWLERRLAQTGCRQPAAQVLQIAGGGPLHALELAEDEALDQRDEVLRDLATLKSGVADPVGLATRWNTFGADRVLGWLLAVFAAMVRQHIDASDTKNSMMINHLQQLANELDWTRLIACHDLVMRNYQSAMGPFNLNNQGLLEEIIIHWRATLETAGGRSK